MQKHFPLSVFVFIDSLVVSASQDAGGHIPWVQEVFLACGRKVSGTQGFQGSCHALSRQKNLTFGIGLHVAVVRTVSLGVRYVINKFPCFHRLPIYLSNGTPPRALMARGSSAISPSKK